MSIQDGVMTLDQCVAFHAIVVCMVGHPLTFIDHKQENKADKEHKLFYSGLIFTPLLTEGECVNRAKNLLHQRNVRWFWYRPRKPRWVLFVLADF